MKKIVVTGGAGFIGSAVVRQFIAETDVTVINVDKLTYAGNLDSHLRKSSQTFGQWVGEILSAENKRQLWIPEGFAHGFVVLSETAEFLYKTTDYYAPAHERCIRWNDATLNIRWPEGIEPSLSAKDAQGKALADAEVFA